MNPEIVLIHRKEYTLEDGMLFVRTEGIPETMVKAPLIIAGLIVVALTIPIQTSFSSTRILDLTLYSDGSTHISAHLDVDPLEPDFEVNLFGPSVDNFVAVGENGFYLSSEIVGDKVTIDTFGSSSIAIDYDIQIVENHVATDLNIGAQVKSTEVAEKEVKEDPPIIQKEKPEPVQKEDPEIVQRDLTEIQVKNEEKIADNNSNGSGVDSSQYIEDILKIDELIYKNN